MMELEKQFPNSQYNIVKTGPNRASFVWARYLTADEQAQREEARKAKEGTGKVIFPPGSKALCTPLNQTVEILDGWLENGQVQFYRIKREDGEELQVPPTDLAPLAEE